MKKFVVLTLAVVVLFVMAAVAFAVPASRTLEFESKMGKVTFSGKVHAEKGLKCADCHPAVFKMKKGADAITMKDMDEGKFCGHCHNGTKAFSVKEAANCTKCHKK